MSVSNPYSASFKLQQQQQQKSPTQAYRPKSVRRSTTSLTLLADGLAAKKESFQAHRNSTKQEDFAVANLGARSASASASNATKYSQNALPDSQTLEAAKITGNYPTSLPFVVPQAGGNSTLSLVAKESIYSGSFRAMLNIPRPTDAVFDTPIHNTSGENLLEPGRLTVFQFPAHLPVATKPPRSTTSTRARSQSAPTTISAAIMNNTQADGRTLTSYLQRDNGTSGVAASDAAAKQQKTPVIPNKSPLTTFGDGKIGRLVRHQSGCVYLVLNNGVRMSLTQGHKADFAEVLYSLDTQKQAAHALGSIVHRGTFSVDYLQ